ARFCVAMTDAQASLIEAVRQRLGPRAVITDPREIEPWLNDWRGRGHGAAPAIIAPSSTAEGAEVVKLAVDLCVPLVPQGGNTGMVAGATPPVDGSALLLSTRKMNRIHFIIPEKAPRVAEGGM